ncbi:unnamed protein product [Closterium sp. NIES-65]|nr:unnamed protein product [Closterium sp. NIES-65]
MLVVMRGARPAGGKKGAVRSWGFTETELLSAQAGGEGDGELDGKERDGIVTRRLLIGAGLAVLALPVALYDIPLTVAPPTKPLFFYVVPLVRLQLALQAIVSQADSLGQYLLPVWRWELAVQWGVLVALWGGEWGPLVALEGERLLLSSSLSLLLSHLMQRWDSLPMQQYVPISSCVSPCLCVPLLIGASVPDVVSLRSQLRFAVGTVDTVRENLVRYATVE